MSEYHAGCNSGLLKVLNASIGPMCGAYLTVALLLRNGKINFKTK
jgi:hypothetical protein